MAMKHGKHVLVEKPAAASCDEIEQLIACAKETGVKCMPVHNYVYEPSLLRVKDMITSGTTFITQKIFAQSCLE
eukprot:m.138367 g.138367  ORF g.138367 m.138367 type:complete len:74 (-) comp14775_c0_seq11:555-776(-)